jgi:preprotein translocase subunit SecF
MRFFRLANICMALSAILVAVSIVLLFIPGPSMSIEFTGGTLMELSVPAEKGSPETLHEAVSSFARTDGPLIGTSIARTKTGTFFLRTPTLSNEEHLQLLAHMKQKLGAVEELQYTTIGPTVGTSLKRSAVFALGIAAVAIIIYIAFAFRRMPSTLNPWIFGTSAVVALIHDIAITVGIFTILSKFTTFQVDTLFVTALLSIMGHSVSDTIVIFDRIRDNVLHMGQREDFAFIAAQSLRQCLSRSINMSVAVLTLLTALFLLGSESIHWFVLTLIIGTIIGAYSSYFIATPIVVLWRARQRRR